MNRANRPPRARQSSQPTRRRAAPDRFPFWDFSATPGGRVSDCRGVAGATFPQAAGLRFGERENPPRLNIGLGQRRVAHWQDAILHAAQCRRLKDQFDKARLDAARQHRAPLLRAPDYLGFEAEDSPGIVDAACAPSFVPDYIAAAHITTQEDGAPPVGFPRRSPRR